MKTVLKMVGSLAIAMGLLWIGQGTGAIEWPRSSFMIDQRGWAVKGALLAAAGALLLLWARRR